MMHNKKIKHRILYTTGGFCDVLGTCALESAEEKDYNYVNHVILHAVDFNEQFINESKRSLSKLLKFETFTLLSDFIVDHSKTTLDVNKLKNHFLNFSIKEVFMFAESSGTRFDAFTRAFPNAKRYVYEEGMLGYCASIFFNSKLGGLKSISKFYTTNYFEKVFPQSLKEHSFEIEQYNFDILKQKFDLISVGSKLDVERLNEIERPKVIFCSAPLWRFEQVSREKVLIEHYSAITEIINKGFCVLFKDHPRAVLKLFDDIEAMLSVAEKEHFVDASEVEPLAENLISKIRPSAVVGFGSTVLFNGPQIFDVPSFCYKTELVPISIHNQKQHIVNAALKVRYIPPLSNLLSVNVKGNSSGKVSELLKISFNEYLEKRGSSLEDYVVQSVFKKLYYDKVIIPKDEDIVRRFINTGKAPINFIVSENKERLSLGKKFNEVCSKKLGIRLITTKRYRSLLKERKGLKKNTDLLKKDLTVLTKKLEKIENTKESLNNISKVAKVLFDHGVNYKDSDIASLLSMILTTTEVDSFKSTFDNWQFLPSDNTEMYRDYLKAGFPEELDTFESDILFISEVKKEKKSKNRAGTLPIIDSLNLTLASAFHCRRVNVLTGEFDARHKLSPKSQFIIPENERPIGRWRSIQDYSIIIKNIDSIVNIKSGPMIAKGIDSFFFKVDTYSKVLSNNKSKVVVGSCFSDDMPAFLAAKNKGLKTVSILLNGIDELKTYLELTKDVKLDSFLPDLIIVQNIEEKFEIDSYLNCESEVIALPFYRIKKISNEDTTGQKAQVESILIDSFNNLLRKDCGSSTDANLFAV